MQDRADVVAAVVMRLLGTGHKELVAALNNAFIKEGQFAPAIKVAGESFHWMVFNSRAWAAWVHVLGFRKLNIWEKAMNCTPITEGYICICCQNG